MDIRLQAKLLARFCKTRNFAGWEERKSFTWTLVIAATHRDLLEAIQNRTIREDLYYRINVFTLTLPSLRERKEDIIDLAEFLMALGMARRRLRRCRLTLPEECVSGLRVAGEYPTVGEHRSQAHGPP